MPVAIRHGSIFHAARLGQHLKADECRFRGQHLVLVAQKGADDVGHDAFGTTAGNHVLYLQVEFFGENAAKTEPAIRVDIDPAYVTCDLAESKRRGPERIFVRSEFGDSGKPVLALDLVYGAAWLVGPQLFDIPRNQRHPILVWHRDECTTETRRRSCVRRASA